MATVLTKIWHKYSEMEINFIVRGNIPLTTSLSAADKKNSYAIILQMWIASSKSLNFSTRIHVALLHIDLEYNLLNGFHWNYAKFLFEEIIWVW